MVHLKRERAPKSWRTSRKGTSFVAMPVSTQGVPLVVALRDILGIVQNKKEVKKAIRSKSLLVNNKPVKEEGRGLSLFDTLSLVTSDTHYRINLSEKGKYKLEEIGKQEANKKISKITGKKMLKKGKIQANLSDGKNFLVDKKVNTNDSVQIDLKERKISKHIPLKENSKVVVFGGRHTGKEGEVESLDTESRKALVVHGEEKINVPLEKIIATE